MSLPLLVDLSLRGSLVFLAVLLVERMLAGAMTARWRRIWWLLVPLAFLLPIRLTPAWLTQSPPAPPITIFHGHVLLPAAGWKAPWASHPANALAGAGFDGIALLWTLGAAVGALRVILPTWRAQCQWSGRRLSTDPALLNLLEDAKATAGVTAPIGLIVATDVVAPALLGWLRPRILIPAPLAASAPDDLRAVLLHELAHFKCLDIPANWLFTLARVVHWFNPLAWLALAAWTRFREEAADEQAIRWLNEPTGAAYGEILLKTLQKCSGGGAPYGALAIGESVHHLKRRILMIHHHSRKSNRPALAAFVTLLLGALLALAPALAADNAQDADKKAATDAMQAWLAESDAGDFAKTWTDASKSFQKAVTSDQWVSAATSVRKPLGKVMTRKLDSAVLQSSTTGVGMPKGTFVVAQFDTSFENMKAARETVTFQKEDDGGWRAAGYYIKPQ